MLAKNVLEGSIWEWKWFGSIDVDLFTGGKNIGIQPFRRVVTASSENTAACESSVIRDNRE